MFEVRYFLITDNHVILVQRMLGSQQMGSGGSSGYQVWALNQVYYTIHFFCYSLFMCQDKDENENESFRSF